MKDNFDIIDELFTELKDFKPLKMEDSTRLKKKFRLEFNYNSNHIEGNTLTYGETELLLIFDDTTGNHHMREYEEIKAHDVAYQFIEELSNDNDRPLTEQIIKNLNEIILVRPYWKDALTPDGQKTRRLIDIGDYKKQPNSVRLANGEIFEYASPVDTPNLMQELIQWLKDEEHAIPPVTLAAILHYKFVRIHPFDDGNGRISRLLMNYILLRNDYPPVIIKSDDKENYLRVLHIAHVGDYEPLINYVSELVIWSLKIGIKAAKGEALEDADDFIKEIELLNRKASIKDTSKSPGVVYKSFKLIGDKIWPAIINTLKHFDSLFNESRNYYEVNNFPKKEELFGVIESMQSFAINGTKIWNVNVYETDINNLKWEHMMYALKGTKIPINTIISVLVEFNNLNYSLYLTLDNSIILHIEKKYLEVFLDNDIEAITALLKKSLLEHVSSRID
jgi:Fic family protein